MKISIIVPFYNVEPYFRRCLDSIVNQSHRDLEIILVDDCSPDNSLAIAKEYADKDDRISIIRHEVNKGLGGARNSGLDVASGEYLWFIDSDDEISTPYALEYLLYQIQEELPDVILMKTLFVNTENEVNYTYANKVIYYDQQSYKNLYVKGIFHALRYNQSIDLSVCSKLLRRSFLKQYDFKFLEKTMHEDYIMSLYLPLAKSVIETPLALYSYIQRPGSITTGRKPKDYLEHLNRVINQLKQFYQKELTEVLDKYLYESLIIYLYSSYNVISFIETQGSENKDSLIIKIYDDLHAVFGDSIELLQLRPRPSRLLGDVTVNLENWEKLEASFDKPLKNKEKIVLIQEIFGISHSSMSTASNNTKYLLAKLRKIVKMFLPYGLVRLIQILKIKGISL